MIQQIIGYLYPDFTEIELKKFKLLSVTFFIYIGSFWILHVLKDTMLFKIAFPELLGWPAGYGRLIQPMIKFGSPFVVIAVVLIYSKLVDIFKKHQLFYIICSFYACVFLGIAGILSIRTMHGDLALGKTVLSITGLVAYFATESFSSLLVALFWSFAASICTTEQAKKGFALVVAGGQIGAIFGSLLTLYTEKIGGVASLYVIASMCILSITGMIWYFMRVIPASELIGNPQAAQTEKRKEGFIEGFVSGIVLLISRPYLLGVLVISTVYDIAAQIVDYQMKAQVDIYPGFSGELGFSYFHGIYGLCVNTVAFLIALLGTRYLLKEYGIKFCLLLYPVCFGIALIALYLFFQLGNPTVAQLLWSTFGVMVIIKSLSYALNNPTKDMMYIPTSKDAKFKSKGWIDMFGGRLAKMMGARVSDFFKHDLAALMQFGTLISLGLIGFWVIVAMYVGKRNAELVSKGEIVE